MVRCVNALSQTTETFAKARLGALAGYAREGFDVTAFWAAMEAEVQRGQPFYGLKEWRRVYRVSRAGMPAVFAKLVDERCHEKHGPWGLRLTTEAGRYYQRYLRLCRLQVPTAPLLFAFSEGMPPWYTQSVLATEELQGFCSWSEFFAGAAPRKPQPALIAEVLRDMAAFTARLHRAGAYFSLDSRNVFLRRDRQPGAGNIAIIDLDHVHFGWGGHMPRRRRERNLQRFQHTLLQQTAGITPGAIETFLADYADALAQPPPRPTPERPSSP